MAFETDVYADWKVNANFTISLLARLCRSRQGSAAVSGSTKNFAYGMVYVGIQLLIGDTR